MNNDSKSQATHGIRPNNSVVQRLAGASRPDESSFTLVGDANAFDLGRLVTSSDKVLDGALDALDARVDQVRRDFFHGPRSGEVLLELDLVRGNDICDL